MIRFGLTLFEKIRERCAASLFMPIFLVIVFLVMVTIGSYRYISVSPVDQIQLHAQESILPWTEYDDQSLHHTMLRRARKVMERCREHPEMGRRLTALLDKTNFNFVVNDAHKLLVCYIPKVGSSNIGRMLLSLEAANKNRTLPGPISSEMVNQFYGQRSGMRGNSKTEKLHKLLNYKRVMVVREPFERLISAFNSKLIKHVDPAYQWLIQHIKSLRQKPSNDPLTFAEFVRFLLNQKPSEFDRHWARYTDLCHPCSVKYDYIGRYETINEDMTVLLDDIGAAQFVRFPERKETYRGNKSVTYIEQYYKTIPRAHLQKLREIYSEDARLFDYAFPEALSKLLQ